jgi:hypothetical protein
MFFAAADVPQEPEAVEERNTYIITTPDGKLPVFWDEAQIQSGADWVRVEVDEPWEPRVWQGKQSLVTVEGRERKSNHDERIKKGYEEHGYVEIHGRFVPQTEVVLAERAFAMAGLAQPVVSDDAAPTASASAPLPATSVTQDSNASEPIKRHRSSFLKKFAPHIAILFIAGVLVTLTFQKTFA